MIDSAPIPGTRSKPVLRRTLLQVIENREIGGAQRSVALLEGLPGTSVTTLTYDELPALAARATFDGLLVHVWRNSRIGGGMNWPAPISAKFHKRLAFSHDWCGQLRGYDGYIVYSEFARRNSEADRPVYVVPGGLRRDTFRLTGPRAGRGVIVGRLSTMWPGKISSEVLRPWRQIRADAFVVAGDGPRLPELKAEYACDERFRFPGAIAPNAVPRFLSQIDLFLYDTDWHVESFCYVTLQAMAAACVVVARAKGAIPEQIVDGVTGFLYESPREAVRICNELIADPARRSRVASQAREYALANYPVQRLLSGVLRAFGWQTDSGQPSARAP